MAGIYYNWLHGDGTTSTDQYDANGQVGQFMGRADGNTDPMWSGYTTTTPQGYAQAAQQISQQDAAAAQQRSAALQAMGLTSSGAAPGGGTFGGGSGGAAAQPARAPVGPSGQMAYGSSNPFLEQMGQGLSDQMLKTFQRQTLPGISSGAAASGGYGSSRQGVLEANAMNDFSQNQGAALTNLFGQGYSTGLNYDLGVRNNNSANAANANQYDLGLRNNDLAYAGLDRQINNDNLNWQLQGAQLGLQGNQALQAGNAQGQTAAGNIQNTPINYWQQFSNVANGFGQGYSTQTGTVNQQGSPLMGALGGAQLGSSLWNQYNGSGGASAGAGASNNYFGGSGGLGGFDNSAAGFGSAF